MVSKVTRFFTKKLLYCKYDSRKLQQSSVGQISSDIFRWQLSLAVKKSLDLSPKGLQLSLLTDDSYHMCNIVTLVGKVNTKNQNQVGIIMNYHI